MPHHPPEVQAALQQTEDTLVSVGALLSRTTEAALEDMVPEADLKLREAYRLSEALQRWLLLHRAPAPNRYDPQDLPRILSGTLQLANLLPPAEGAPTCEGDLAQVVTCLKLLAENVSLEGDGVFRAALQAESPSSVLVTLDGEGRLPEVLVIEGVLHMPWAAFEACWARATCGGAVIGTGGRLLLGLEGGEPDYLAPPAALEQAWKCAVRLSRRLRAWRGAMGLHEPGMVSPSEMRSLYEEAVRQSLVDLGELRSRLAA